jgi:hypothetical protein
MNAFRSIGERVIVERTGVPATEAEIVANNWHRPHLVKVAFGRSHPGEWIFRSTIAGPAGTGPAALPRS